MNCLKFVERRVLRVFTHFSFSFLFFFKKKKKKKPSELLNGQMCIQTSNEIMQIKNIYCTLNPLPKHNDYDCVSQTKKKKKKKKKKKIMIE
jgi:hypothetical protein